MSKYRTSLPQLSGRRFVTDGGLETTLVYLDGIDLPHFAAFDLLRHASGRTHLADYYRRYAAIARRHRLGFVLEAPTWRASPDWAERLGLDLDGLATLNRRAIGLLASLRDELETADTPIVISGNLGPRGDGYVADRRMGIDEAAAYHAFQLEQFADSEADMASAFTLTYVDEAIGIVRAASAVSLPVVISFTVETDGRLPSGESLAEAIERTDAETGAYAAYFMLNCAHPAHFDGVLDADAAWARRLRGLRANASTKSHAELDASTALDAGDPQALAAEHRALLARLPWLSVLGGCCGTDHRHVASICEAMS